MNIKESSCAGTVERYFSRRVGEIEDGVGHVAIAPADEDLETGHVGPLAQVQQGRVDDDQPSPQLLLLLLLLLMLLRLGVGVGAAPGDAERQRSDDARRETERALSAISGSAVSVHRRRRRRRPAAVATGAHRNPRAVATPDKTQF